ncbi:secretory phospholipase A2 receptor-like [Saccoglossus kowalevskii]
MSTTSRLSTAMPSNNVSQTPALPLDTTRVMEAKSPTTVRINSPRDRDPREVEGGTPSELGGDSLTTDQGSYRPGYQFPGFDGPGYVAGDEDLGHQWLVLDFGAQVAIMRIVLGGVRGPDFEAFVKKFRLEYSDDGEAWFIYGDPSNGQLIELEGLSYVDEVKEIELQFILIARFLKIVPIEVENLFALKIRIYGYLYQDYAEYMHQMETLYYLIVEDPVSWHDAKYYCEYWGGFLATIPHAIVQHHLRREIQLYNLVGNWWFSPTDADNEGVWINSHDGKDLIFSDWLNGQLPENDVNKNCAQLLESEGYEWNHDLCDNSHNYICQFINEPDYSNLQYPDRDEQANAKADTQQIKAIDLFYIAEPANRFTWEDANNYCIGTGGSLLRIEQPEVQDTYAHLMSQYGIEGRFWLDPTNTVSHPNTHGWVYTNGQPIIYNVGLKDDSASVAKCAAMNSVAGFSWTAEKCADRTEGFFCQYYGERTPFSMDADSSLDVEEIYYEIVRVVNGFDWYRAQSYCQEEGGHLVRIEEQEIQEFLASKLNEHGFTGDYYIDAIMNDLGQVIYTNNEYVIYNDFHSSYPQGGCVYLAGGAMWRWEDGDCKMGRNFICQFYGNIHHNEPESGVDETTETETKPRAGRTAAILFEFVTIISKSN